MEDGHQLKCIVEAALLAAGRPLSLDELLSMFEEAAAPARTQVREALAALEADYAERGVEVAAVGGGFRIQTRQQYAPWVSRLWEEKPARYSRATLETLALIAYRQPVTRGEIEEIRGVSVASNLIRALTERGWIRVVGHRDVPGRPALFSTTKEFLNYFGLNSLSDLPPLAEIRDLDAIDRELDLGPDPSPEADAEVATAPEDFNPTDDNEPDHDPTRH